MRRAGGATERIQTGDPDTDAIWRRMKELYDTINASPFMFGRLITEDPDVHGAIQGSGIIFSASVSRAIPHGLGRRARGFMEVYSAKQTVSDHVGLSSAAYPTGKSEASYISVMPTNSGRCWIWVF